MRFFGKTATLLILLMHFPLSAGSQTTDENHSSEVDELFALVDEWIFNDPAKAKEYAEQALELSNETGNTEGEIKGLFAIGEILIRTADRDKAIQYFEEGIQKARSGSLKKLRADGHYHLSRYYEGASQYASALDHIRQALKIFEELELEDNIANSNNSMGRIYQEIGDYSTALTYLFEALRINEKLQRKTGMAVSYTIIGNTYLRNSRYDEAIRYFEKSLAIDQEMEDKTGIMISKLNLGAAYQRNQDYETAMEYHRESLDLARELEYREDEAIILDNIGSTYRKLGFPREGLPYMFEGLTIMEETGYNTTPTLNGISKAFLVLYEFDQALHYARLAEQTGRERSDPDRLQDTYLHMAASYEGLSDFEAANRSLKKYNTLQDSLFTIEKEKQISELQIRYETEQRDQTINMLTLEAETASFRRNTYLASGILISIIFLLLYNGQRIKNRKNRQLLDKNREVTRMKSAFFSNISHEFRTPLTLISGPIERLKASAGDPGMQKELEIMQKNSDRLLSLINQLLDLSRLESGSLTLGVEKTDLISLVKGVTLSFQSLAELRQIRLLIASGIDFMETWIDRDKLETILINLIGNAIKFSPDGGEVLIRINETTNRGGLKWCQIHVVDNGRGISETELEHIFDRFYRSREMKQSQISGSGIGLALTKELVLLHKGGISVESKPGEGTEFIVELPVSKQHYDKKELNPVIPAKNKRKTDFPEISSVSQPVSDSPDDDASPLLLLIEDNEDVLNYLTDILNESYKILAAPDGKKGVMMARKHIPDLVISDVMMPKMDGFRVADILKQDEKTSHIPLILLTAKASREDKIKGLKTYADDYVTKPFRPEELLLRIKNLINIRKQLKKKYYQKIEIKPEALSTESIEEEFLLRVVNNIKKNLLNENFSVDILAREVSMSRSQLHRKLVALTDQSASEFIRSYRLNLAKNKIRNGEGSISEIAYEVGFNSPSYFSRAFREKFGESPSAFEGRSGDSV